MILHFNKNELNKNIVIGNLFILILFLFIKISTANASDYKTLAKELHDKIITAGYAATCVNVIAKVTFPSDISDEYRNFLDKKYGDQNIIKEFITLYPNFTEYVANKSKEFNKNNCKIVLEQANNDFLESGIDNSILLRTLADINDTKSNNDIDKSVRKNIKKKDVSKSKDNKLSFKEGTTTKQEVIDKLGSPSSITDMTFTYGCDKQITNITIIQRDGTSIPVNLKQLCSNNQFSSIRFFFYNGILSSVQF